MFNLNLHKIKLINDTHDCFMLEMDKDYLNLVVE